MPVDFFKTEASPHSLKFYMRALESEPDSGDILRDALIEMCAAGPLRNALANPERLTTEAPAGLPNPLDDSAWERIPFSREVSLYVTQRTEPDGGPVTAWFVEGDAGPTFRVNTLGNCTALIEIRFNHSIKA